MHYVMYDGLVLGELYVSDTNKLRFKRDEGIEDCWLPLFLRYTVEVHDKDVDLTHAYVIWVEERVIPSNRIGLKRILDKLGMKKYDMLEVAKKTNVCQLTDPYWVTYSDSDTFTKNSLRGIYGYDANILGLNEEDYRWKI